MDQQRAICSPLFEGDLKSTYQALVFVLDWIISRIMTRPVNHISRLAATFLFAIALLFAGFAPAHQAMKAPGEHVATNADMPCETMMGHAPAMMADEMPDNGQTNFDLCCGGALCAADTIRDGQDITLGVPQTLAFAQMPPDALHVSDNALPERPPRLL
ncbi:hypothetical protein ACSSV1_005386 [Labrenzia sp. MBR-25]|jgi:hypothetical protein